MAMSAVDLPESIFSMNGWCTKQKATRIYNLVLDHKPLEVLELGVFAGRSFIPMALALKKNGKGNITGIDPWARSNSLENYKKDDPNFIWWNSLDHDMIFKCFKDALSTYDVEKYSRYLRGTSNDCCQSFADQSIDVLHQDGNHSEETSSMEVNIYTPKVKKGGYWIMDDTDWESTKRAQNLILDKGFTLYEDHISWKIYKKH